MNTMTNAMTWDAIAANEGSEIEAMTSTEADEVSGGHPIIQVVVRAVTVIGGAFATAYAAQRGVNLANKHDGKP